MSVVPAPHVAEFADDYWSQTRRPLVCLIFLLPLLAIYELGVLSLGGASPDGLRNGADVWMRGGLEWVGITQPVLLPLLVIVGLLGWHITAKHPTRVSADTLPGMFAESLLFAFALMAIGQTTYFLFELLAIPRMSVGDADTTAVAVTYLGAGIYEEVLFRLCLLPICFGLCRGIGLTTRWSAGIAVFATSFAFSMAHYIGPAGEAFDLFTFSFRMLAGAFFGMVFVCRGFGITVGCHAAYDLFVGVLMG